MPKNTWAHIYKLSFRKKEWGNSKTRPHRQNGQTQIYKTLPATAMGPKR